MSGLTDKISGKSKQAAGKVTDDKQLQAEGKLEEAKGALKDTFNDVSKAVGDKIEEAKTKTEEK